MSSSLRLGNMVGGLGWLRRRVCTCRLGSPIHQTDKKWMDFLHFRDFASPTMAHPRCRELCKRAGSLRLAELFRPILFLLLPGSYSFLKVDGSGVWVSAGSTLVSRCCCCRMPRLQIQIPRRLLPPLSVAPTFRPVRRVCPVLASSPSSLS